MTFKTLCVGLMVAMAASTFGCGAATSPTATSPTDNSAVTSDQAQATDEATSADAAAQPDYSTQAVVVRHGYVRPRGHGHTHVYVRPHGHRR